MQRVGEDVLAAQIAALRWSEPRGGLRARLKSRVEHASIVLEVLVENVSVESLVVQADDPMSLRVWATRDGIEVRPSFERIDVMSSQRRTPLPPGEVLAWCASALHSPPGVLDVITRGWELNAPLLVHAALASPDGELTLLPVEVAPC